MKSTTPTALPRIQTTEFLSHGQAILDALEWLEWQVRLLDESMGDVADDTENIAGYLSRASDKLASYLSRILLLGPLHCLTDEDHRAFIAEKGETVPSISALADIMAIIGKDNQHKPANGWDLCI